MQIIFLGHLYKVDLSLRVVTISWLIIGCGPEYMVPGYGSYGSETCGRLSVPVDIYIDGCVHAFHFVCQTNLLIHISMLYLRSPVPFASYNPLTMPSKDSPMYK